MTKSEKIQALRKEIRYEKRKMNCCGYGKSDLYYLMGLENELEELLKFKWQHIDFIDGSNPYICKTESELKKMQEQYVLEQTGENLWKATHKISYIVMGYGDVNKKVTFSNMYHTKKTAMRFINKEIEKKRFEKIVLRKKTSCLTDETDFSFGDVIETFNNIKREQV